MPVNSANVLRFSGLIKHAKIAAIVASRSVYCVSPCCMRFFSIAGGGSEFPPAAGRLQRPTSYTNVPRWQMGVKGKVGGWSRQEIMLNGTPELISRILPFIPSFAGPDADWVAMLESPSAPTLPRRQRGVQLRHEPEELPPPASPIRSAAFIARQPIPAGAEVVTEFVQ